jgi:hypothetical protein
MEERIQRMHSKILLHLKVKYGFGLEISQPDALMLVELLKMKF